MKTVGILALQGDFAVHAAALARAGAEPVLVRGAEDLDVIDGLVMPGGESTAMLKLLHYDRLMEPLALFLRVKPVLGTCAGAILLAKKVTGPSQESFAVIDIDVERNAYGRQTDSHIARIASEPEFTERTSTGMLEAIFIRAPVIRHTGPQVKVLAKYEGNPILVEQGLHMAATFHPELTEDTRVHKLFLGKL